MKITDLIKKNTLRNIRPATPATPATLDLDKEAVATVATVAKGSDQDSRIKIRIDPDKKTTDYDNFCWPNSSAFNSVEVKLTLERLRFLGSRLSEDDAERMADRLIARDRQRLDMIYCFECHHLEGFGSGPWRCNNAIEAEVNISKKISSVPRDWPWMLMRCFGFRGLLDQLKTDE
jgi:hypothetical protein